MEWNRIILLAMIAISAVTSCKKEIQPNAEVRSAIATSDKGHLAQTKTFPSIVATKWMGLEIHIMQSTAGIPNVAFVRPMAYSGIALYESVVNGMAQYQSLGGQLNGLSGLPQTGNGLGYHWGEAANAALASINRSMFPTTSAANKTSIDSLENALKTEYLASTDAETITRSEDFGKAVAQKVFAWSETDGYQHASDAYTPPQGDGLWVPTPPANAPASTPYWGNLRLMVTGSTNNAQPGPPVAYSKDPASDFFQMVKTVYDANQNLTADQTAQALFWRDIPGVSTPGHYLSILKQVLENNNQLTLVDASIAAALTGIVGFDASVSCWKTKYQYNLVRPVTYIRDVMGFQAWLPLLTTPAHPEYSSAHAVLSAGVAEALTFVFGENYAFTDHTYDYLGMAARPFNSFRAFGEDAGNSRLYAGIHYQPSINTGLVQGRTVAHNITASLILIKE